jgi:hypothetical protein
MSLLPPLGETWLIILECQGSIPGKRFLDGNTVSGDLQLVSNAGPSGTRWAITAIAPSMHFLRCLGTLEAPFDPPPPTPPGLDVPRPTRRILDGRTQDHSVALVRDDAYLLSGSRWEVVEVASEIVTLRCLGDIEGEGRRFLDGDTVRGSVQLAPSPDGVFTGARWRVHVLGIVVTLECMGAGIGGGRFLEGEAGGKVRLQDFFTATVATLWQMNGLAGAITLKCLGDTGPESFLDGHTLDATVGLAPSTDPPFSGTRWARNELDQTTSSLRCLGSDEGLGKRFLDGLTSSETLALAPHTGEPFTGTHWRIRHAGEWWIPCRFPAAPASGPFRVVSTTRLGQLTGTTDPQSRPLLNCKTDQWGVLGVDLGANAEHSDGKLYIFFGDVIESESATQAGILHDADLVAWTTAPSAEALVQGGPGVGPHACALQAALDRNGHFYEPFTIGRPSGLPDPNGPIIGPLLSAETPVGAFSFDGRMYVFVWIGEKHSPQLVPAGSHLVSKQDPSAPGLYSYEFMMSALFGPKSSFSQVAPVVVRTLDFEDLPQASGKGLVIFGQGNSERANSDAVHLAWMPLVPGRRPSLNDILYYAGDSQPACQRWDRNPDCAIPLFVLPRKQYTALSAAWLDGPKRWVLIYSKGNDDDLVKAPVVARFGSSLLSWSDEVVLFDPCRDRAYGADGYMHWPGIDDITRRVGPFNGFKPTNAYGAFLVPRFTRWNLANRELNLYYLLSLFHPYQVQLMKSQITMPLPVRAVTKTLVTTQLQIHGRTPF